jgi:hypothetical protein
VYSLYLKTLYWRFCFGSVPRYFGFWIRFNSESTAHLGIISNEFYVLTRQEHLWRRFVQEVLSSKELTSKTWFDAYKELVEFTWVPSTDKIKVTDRTFVYEDHGWSFCKTNKLMENREYTIVTQCAGNKNNGLGKFC